MEFLVAALVTMFSQFLKWIFGNFGQEEMAKHFILVGVFLLSVTGTFLYSYLMGDFSFSSFDGKKLSEIFFISIGYYEVIVKRLIIPAFTASTSEEK